MNICQVITPSRISGAERSTMGLCEHLQRAGHRVRIGCKAGSPLIEAMRAAGLDVHSLRISGKGNLLAPFRLAGFARDFGAEVLHSQLSSAAVHATLAGRLLHIPSIAHVRALNSALCYRFATRVIAVSHAVRDHLVRQGLSGERVDVVYNGVDPARYYLPCTREEARVRLGLPLDALVVGVVAHLTEKKGHAVFLEAFRQLAAQCPDAVALFLGEGGQREPLELQAESLGLSSRVQFCGFHADVLPFYAAMDIVALPSIGGEGLPRALLEGGLLRRPCVGTRLSGAPEIVREGETGFLVPIRDAAALADRLQTLAGDAALRERFGAAAHDWISTRFSVQAMIDGTLNCYERALGER